MGRRDEDVELELAHHFTTDKAYKVSEFGEDTDAVFLPKSMVGFFPTKRTVAETSKKYPNKAAKQIPIVKIICPAWLATEKGLT